MTYLRTHYQTIIIVLVGSIAFGLIDLYVINLSNYVCGGLLAWIWLERKKDKPSAQEIMLKTGGEPLKCVSPCNGNLKKIAAKKPGGIEQHRCPKCHRKFQVVNGKLRQVAV